MTGVKAKKKRKAVRGEKGSKLGNLERTNSFNYLFARTEIKQLEIELAKLFLAINVIIIVNFDILLLIKIDMLQK